MKKFLSLVLALVMTMSLVTVSAGAADFDDADDITYVEAAEVLSELGIMVGDSDGFRPNDTLKRSEAAKIICALNLTAETANTLTADTAPFADVAKSHWAAGYIAEGVDSGIIAGVGDNKFAPDGQLTGYAFLKMLLVSLGYDATIEGLTGANWSINVAKLAKKHKLTKGIENFVGSQNVTREEAAQMALNTLTANVVKYADKGTQITVNGAVIATGASDATITSNVFYSDENRFDTLVRGTVVNGDDLGRPAHTWRYGKTKIGTYADVADYSFIVDSDLAGDGIDLLEYMDDEKILEDVGYVTDATFAVNGEVEDYDDVTDTWSDKTHADTDAALVEGAKVEVFTNKYENVTAVVVYNYSLAKITKVDTKVSKADKEDGVAAYITLKTIDGATTIGRFDDDKIAGYDAETYTKDAYVLYVASGAKVIASEIAEVVEGTVSAVKGSKVAIDGTYYKDLTGTIVNKDSGLFFLNAAGQIMATDSTTNTSDKFAFVYKVVDNKKTTSEDGVDVYGDVAYVVLPDGTKASYTLDVDDSVVANKVYAYSINSDDEFVVEGVDADVYSTKSGTAAAQIDKNNANALGYDLLGTPEFIFADWNDAQTKVTVKTVTGYKNIKIAKDTPIAVVANDDGEALYVFVLDANKKVSGKYAVMIEANANVTENADGDVFYTYYVAVDGEETEITAKKDNKLSSIYQMGVYSYDENGDYVENIAPLGKEKVKSVNDDYFRTDADTYTFDDETIYTITVEYKTNSSKIDSVTVSEGGEIEKDSDVVVILDSNGDLDIVYVYEYIY